MLLSKHDVWLRSLSVLFALASVYGIYRLAKQLFDRETALLSSFFLSISPLFINHAQEVRYYIVSLFFGIVGSLYFCKYKYRLNSSQQYLNRSVWIVARVLAAFTTPLNFVFIVSDFFLDTVIFIARKTKFTWRNISVFLLDYFLITVAILPVAISVYQSSGAHKLTPPIPGISHVLRQIRIFFVYAHVPSPKLLAIFLQLMILTILTVLAFALWQGKHQKYVISIAVWALLPILIVFVFSHVFYSVWISRYILSSLPYLTILLSLGLIELWKRFRIVAIIILSLYLLASGAGLFKYYTTKSRYIRASDRYRAVAHYVCRDRQKGEFLVWSILHKMTLPFTHYCDRDFSIYSLDLPSKTRDRKELTAWVDSIPSSNSEFWLIYSRDSKPLLPSLQEKFTIEEHKKIDGFSIFLLRNKEQK
ncbi:MAG: glycosyltransferase family 39 protein [Cyanobacteria bacterium SBLK]|nr:glycosyltransferase family 39 protein [Cyanobacteria bacterium SBLK]